MTSDDTLGICIAGATGWTGKALVQGVLEAPDLRLASAVARSTAGRDVGEALGREPIGVPVRATVAEALDGVDVMIDFTSHTAAKANAQAAIAAGVAVVIGSSGLTADDFAELEGAARARSVGVVASGNFSLTAAMCSAGALLAARHLPYWEVIDYASATKPDAPSGTARELAERLGEVRAPAVGYPLDDVHGPREARGATVDGTQVHSVRVPSFVVSTEVVFGMPDERLTIRHDAGGTPEPYVAGTLLAARRAPALVGLTRGLDTLLVGEASISRSRTTAEAAARAYATSRRTCSGRSYARPTRSPTRCARSRSRRRPTSTAYKRGIAFGMLPAEYGGGGLSNVDLIIAAEELCAVDPGFACTVLVNGLGLMPVWYWGTEEQKDRFLRAATSDPTGEYLVGYAVSEPAGTPGGTANFDAPLPQPVGIGVTAELDGDELRAQRPQVLAVQRRRAGTGRARNVSIVVVRTDPDKGGTEGLSAIMVERGTPGVSYNLISKIGHRLTPNAEIIVRQRPRPGRQPRRGHARQRRSADQPQLRLVGSGRGDRGGGRRPSCVRGRARLGQDLHGGRPEADHPPPERRLRARRRRREDRDVPVLLLEDRALPRRPR